MLELFLSSPALTDNHGDSTKFPFYAGSDVEMGLILELRTLIGVLLTNYETELISILVVFYGVAGIT